MCRLCALTSTFIGNGTDDARAEIVHECMLRSAFDEGGQKEGWGVTDTKNIWKSSLWYPMDVPIWLPKIDVDRTCLMAHLRKASVNTGRLEKDNHPYALDINGTQLLAMHNGYFEGTKWVNWNNVDPSTDSFRAFNDLAVIMKDAPDIITPDIINAWLGLYGEGSHYAALLHWKDNLYALRGKTRPLAAMRINDGYLIHTSIEVLHIMARYVETLFGAEVAKPVVVPDNTLIRFPLGSIDIDLQTITPVHTKTVHVAGYNYNSVPKLPAVVQKPVVKEEVHDGYAIAPAVTKPRTAREELTLKERRRMWGKLAGKLAPLRRELSAYWCASILAYTTEDQQISASAFLTHATPKEFELLEAVLFIDIDDTTWMKPFSPIAMQQINWWNHLVIDGHDEELHRALFDDKFFWLDSAYTRMPDREGKFDNAHFVMPIWEERVLKRIAEFPSTILSTCINANVLAAIISPEPRTVHIFEA